MVFILQNSQNRDSAALHVKLDEIITHLEGPRDDVAGIEVKSHNEIEELQEDLQAVEDRPSRDGWWRAEGSRSQLSTPTLATLSAVLIHDQADRDAIASHLMRYRDKTGGDWADIIDMVTLHPEARRKVVRLLGEIEGHRATLGGRARRANGEGLARRSRHWGTLRPALESQGTVPLVIGAACR
jgi:hypothetical protein